MTPFIQRLADVDACAFRAAYRRAPKAFYAMPSAHNARARAVDKVGYVARTGAASGAI